MRPISPSETGPTRPVVGIGILLLLLACAVAGSTLLSEAVPAELRASAQGLSDLTMGLAGATAGALSGVVVQAWGYATLALLAALATGPLIALLLGGSLRTGKLRPVVRSSQ